MDFNSFEKLLVAAEKGDALSQFLLADLYENGEGVPQDYDEAARWYTECSKRRPVRYCSGKLLAVIMYEKRQGVPQNDAEAFKWYKTAATGGDAKAQYYLAVKYEEGMGLLQDYAEAAKWYKKSADQGDVNAQHYLSALYEKGLATSQEPDGVLPFARKP